MILANCAENTVLPGSNLAKEAALQEKLEKESNINSLVEDNVIIQDWDNNIISECPHGVLPLELHYLS